MWQRGQTNCFIYNCFGRFLFWNTSKGSGCKANTDLDVMIDITGGGQDTPEVREVCNDGELLTVNGEDWHF